jgi:hypothetical protein
MFVFGSANSRAMVLGIGEGDKSLHMVATSVAWGPDTLDEAQLQRRVVKQKAWRVNQMTLSTNCQILVIFLPFYNFRR